jgi:hypothetical protein
VFDEELVLVYRRLEASINPELEMLRFFSEHDFQNVPALHGWYAYHGRPVDARLHQAFVPDGWRIELALDELVQAPERFWVGSVADRRHAHLPRLGPVGSVLRPRGPSLSRSGCSPRRSTRRSTEPSSTSRRPEALEPIRQRGEEIRRLRDDACRLQRPDHPAPRRLPSRPDTVGALERLGSRLRRRAGPVAAERRRKRSPLRDVAGMLRSFAYAASAAPILRGVEVPQGWEERAREEFLAGYMETVETTLLPPSDKSIRRLLAIFELEKAVYELRYELDNRPDWVSIPVAGILRLLEA